MDSAIISDFPEIFTEFRGKHFQLLWRGSRDGFGASDFHGRCDGHANTLTVILATNGSIFGGFTPAAWDSRKPTDQLQTNCFTADDSLKSFLFTLKNPHNVAAQRFALKAGHAEHAIICNSSSGPCFYDIGITGTDGNAYFGYAYTNDTGVDGYKFFTGSRHFEVNEIEVFEITD
jgi:hypothetical protein